MNEEESTITRRVKSAGAHAWAFFRKVLRFISWGFIYFEVVRIIFFVEAVLKIKSANLNFYVGIVLGIIIYVMIYAGKKKRMVITGSGRLRKCLYKKELHQ